MYITVHLKKLLAVTLMVVLAVSAALAGASLTGAVVTGAKPQEGIPLPVIMYHSMLKESNGKNQYIIKPAEFEADMKYLKEKGYTTVFVEDLIRYTRDGESLPEKPILLTFDDGYYNNYLYAFPLAKQYGAKIIISPIGYATDQFSKADANHATYSHITWDQMNEMLESGMVEIQNHTYNLHASKGQRLGAKKLKGEDGAHYTTLLTEDISKMQSEMAEHTGYRPTAFVYPFGAVSEASYPIVKQLGFLSSFTCESRMNYITRDAESLYRLGRYLRPPGKTSAQFFDKILP